MPEKNTKNYWEGKNVAKSCRMDDILIEDKDGQLRCGKFVGTVNEMTKGGVQNEKTKQ